MLFVAAGHGGANLVVKSAAGNQFHVPYRAGRGNTADVVPKEVGKPPVGLSAHDCGCYGNYGCSGYAVGALASEAGLDVVKTGKMIP